VHNTLGGMGVSSSQGGPCQRGGWTFAQFLNRGQEGCPGHGIAPTEIQKDPKQEKGLLGHVGEKKWGKRELMGRRRPSLGLLNNALAIQQKKFHPDLRRVRRGRGGENHRVSVEGKIRCDTHARAGKSVLQR